MLARFAAASTSVRRFTDLCAVLFEERGRVHAVGNSAADEGEPMEHHRRFIGVLGDQLVQDVDEDGEGNDASEENGYLR